MMGSSDITKQVFFIGAWRAQQVTDQLLRQISSQIINKKKFATELQITTEGLELLILNANGQVTRKDKIALENIVDFIDNKYSTTCTLAIVRDKQQKQYTVFVFVCRSDKDASELIQVFKTTKQQLSGEGYNTDLKPRGNNWTLQQREVTTTHPMNGDIYVRYVPNGDVRVVNTERQEGGVTVINTGERHESFSHESVKTSSSDVKEEIHHLQGEVKDIKRLIQGSKGRAMFEKHYGYRILEPTMRPEVTKTEYIEHEISTPPIEHKRGTLYVKNGSYTRRTNAPQVIAVSGGGINQSKRRYKSRGHFVSTSSGSIPSNVNYTKRVYDSQNPYAEVAVKTTNLPIQPVRLVTQNVRQKFVQKPRIYHTPSVSSDIVVKNIEDVYKSRSVRKIYLPPSPTGKSVEYVNSQMIQQAKQLTPPESPGIIDRTDEIEQSTVHVKYSPEVRTFYEDNSEVIVDEGNLSNASTAVNTSIEDHLDDKMRQVESSMNIQQNGQVVEQDDNVIVIKANSVIVPSTDTELQPEIVHVESHVAEFRDEPQIIGGGVYHVKAELANNYEREIAEDESIVVVRSVDDDVRNEQIEIVTSTNEDEINTKAEEAISQKIGNGTVTVINTDEITQGYETIDIKAEEDIMHKIDNGSVTVISTGENTKETEHIHIQNEEEVSQKIENGTVTVISTGETTQEDLGLFGAYIKRPEEFDEKPDEIVVEKAYRYHDDDETAERNTSGLLYMQELKDNFEQKRVRYNETVEHIPSVVKEDANPEANVYVVDPEETLNEIHKSQIQDITEHETNGVITANVDTEIVTEMNFEDENGDDDYELDMEAVRAFTNEPDIVILEADTTNVTEHVKLETEPARVTEEDVHKITTTTEEMVLF